MAGQCTPGPWMAEPMTGRGTWIRGANGNWSALSCGETDAEAEANARLIAAAPDYDAIARDAVEILPIVLEGREAAQGEEDEVLRDLIERFRAVIAKADGRP